MPWDPSGQFLTRLPEKLLGWCRHGEALARRLSPDRWRRAPERSIDKSAVRAHWTSRGSAIERSHCSLTNLCRGRLPREPLPARASTSAIIAAPGVTIDFARFNPCVSMTSHCGRTDLGPWNFDNGVRPHWLSDRYPSATPRRCFPERGSPRRYLRLRCQ